MKPLGDRAREENDVASFITSTIKFSKYLVCFKVKEVEEVFDFVIQVSTRFPSMAR